MKRLILIILLIPTLAGAQTTARIARIDSVLTYLHSHELFNGTVLVGEKGKVLYKKAFGISHPTTKAPLTTASSFNLASISKQFFTMMIMILREQGKLSYDDAVQKHLPTFPYPGITIRHLMNQTSGLPEYFDIAAGRMTLLDTLTNEEMLSILASRKPPLVFQPGEKWEYCNTNYTTLASVLEKVAGMSSDKFFQQYIAGPLKLKNTFIYNTKMKSFPPSRVFGMTIEGGKPILNDLTPFDGIVGDGNVYASVEDLYLWDQALYSEKLVKKATFQEALTPGKLNSGDATRYGFGWFIEEPGKTVTHTGGWVGFSNLIARYIDKNQTIVVLTSSSTGFGPRLVKNIWEGKPIALPVTHLITNVQLIDGTGLPAYAASVRILNDRIRDYGALKPYHNEGVTDGKGQVLAPGFIDSHSHHDWGLEEKPDVTAATNQGITTIVVGQDGGSSPIDSIKALIKKRPISINIASYTGHATLRRKAMGDLARNATEAEITKMSEDLLGELDKGSLGLATGLEYEAAFYSNRDEVVALARVAASKGGRYISHMRSEDQNIEAALDEIITIGREAKIPVQISHFKIAMRSKWGGSTGIIAALERARHEGVDITADVYPYRMWSSTPRVLFPKKDFTNLASAELAVKEFFDPATSVMTDYPPNKSYEGKTVSEIADINHETPAVALMRIIRETDAPDMGGAIMGTSMSEEDITNFLRWEHANVCSDGAIDGHPRGHGAFTRVLGRYVREQKIMSLESAVHKMTGLTAEHMGINNRGLITRGYYADLVLFNPKTVIDMSTVKQATALSVGIEKVWVNGELVYQGQQPMKKYPGRFVERGN